MIAALIAIICVFTAETSAHHKSCADMTATASTIRIHTTSDGMRYGLTEGGSTKPAPTVILLNSHSAKDALQDPFGGRCAELLVGDGFRCVTIDLPCHGAEHRAGEPDELKGWAYRAAKQENFVSEVTRRLSSVLDDLIDRGLTEPARVVACGTSRGGFLACHFAAHDSRVACVVAFAPVTDLTVLKEFRDLRDSPFALQLSISKIVDRLAGLPIWMVIGDRDQRVGTDQARFIARQLTQSAERHNLPGRVQFRIVHEPRGHTLPSHVGDDAAAWVRTQLSLPQTAHVERSR